MEKANEFKKILDVPISKLVISSIVQEVSLHPEYLKDIYLLTSDEKQTVSWRAIWACEKLSETHPDWFLPMREEIIHRLMACTHDGSKRLLLSILYNISASSPISIELLNYCFDHMLAPQESIAVQALCIKMAYILCKNEPELLQELRLILANTEVDYYSTAVKATIRNVLKRIR